MNDPRTFHADDLNASANPTGLTVHTDSTTVEADDVTNEGTGNVSHNPDPVTTEADDVENKPTGKMQAEFSEHPQVSVKVVEPPEQAGPAGSTTAETA